MTSVPFDNPQNSEIDPPSDAIDAQSPPEILRRLHEAQVKGAGVVASAMADIERAAQWAAAALEAGGRLAYVGAGSSGLMAVADGLELPGTFGIPADRITLLLAGSGKGELSLSGIAEDDVEQAIEDVATSNLGAGDCAILVSASGTTPYTVAALRALNGRGSETIGMAAKPGSPLLTEAGLAICLPTAPELVAGSTRMAAGTAQKIALNMISTLTGVLLGHVHAGQMINLTVDNEKLKLRAMGMVDKITGCGEAEAQSLIERSGGSVRSAILLARGVRTVDEAERMLADHDGRLKPCLDTLDMSKH